MITFITAFKKFKKLYDMIQHSAMYSWKANGIPVIAPTNEVDTKGACAGYDNITLIEGVKRGRELGFHTQSPVVKDMIAKALPHIDTPMVGLINSDIIILEDFAQRIQKILDKYGYDVFMAGSRNDIQLKEYANNPETYKKVQQQKRTFYDDSTSSDIFITSKFQWRKIINVMPEFILGRYGYDNFLHMQAELNKLNKFNCSEALTILHCMHNLEHIYAQEGAREKAAPSSQHNLKLWNPIQGMYGTTRIKAWPRIEL